MERMRSRLSSSLWFQCGVFYSGTDNICVGQRRFEVPNALELPGMLCAVVPLVGSERLASAERSVVDEFVALPHKRGIRLRHYFPAGSFLSLVAVARALD